MLEYLYVTPCADLVLVSFLFGNDGGITAIVGDIDHDYDAREVFPFLATAHTPAQVIATLLRREGWNRLVPEACFN